MDEYDRKDVGRCCDSVYPPRPLYTQSPYHVICHMTWQYSVEMYLNLRLRDQDILDIKSPGGTDAFC